MTDDTVDRDPFAPIETTPRGRTALALLGFVAAALAAVGGLAAVAGPVGMAFGAVAHLKGSRLGMPAAVAAAVGMVAGFAVAMFVR